MWPSQFFLSAGEGEEGEACGEGEEGFHLTATESWRGGGWRWIVILV